MLAVDGWLAGCYVTDKRLGEAGSYLIPLNECPFVYRVWVGLSEARGICIHSNRWDTTYKGQT